MKGGAMVLGNHVVEVMVEKAWGLICPLTAWGSSEIIVAIGLYPRKAANNANVGGICDSEDAT
jgi:carbohydrate-binding DOMON domain-containing protein